VSESRILMRVVRPGRETRKHTRARARARARTHTHARILRHRDVNMKIISKINVDMYSLSTTLCRSRTRKEFRSSMSVEYDVGV